MLSVHKILLHNYFNSNWMTKALHFSIKMFYYLRNSLIEKEQIVLKHVSQNQIHFLIFAYNEFVKIHHNSTLILKLIICNDLYLKLLKY